MRYLGRRWYIYAFAAVMAFAAGASMEWQCEGYTAAAISAIGEISGAGLLKLSGYGLLSAAMLYSMAAIAKDVLPGSILKTAALWIKSFFNGLFYPNRDRGLAWAYWYTDNSPVLHGRAVPLYGAYSQVFGKERNQGGGAGNEDGAVRGGRINGGDSAAFRHKDGSHAIQMI